MGYSDAQQWKRRSGDQEFESTEQKFANEVVVEIHCCIACPFSPGALFAIFQGKQISPYSNTTKFTAQLWELFLNITSPSWTMLEHISDLLSCWIRRRVARQKRWWKLISSCIWWSVWRERNGRSLEDRSNSIHNVKWNFLVALIFWRKQLCIEDVDQIIDLIGSL